MKNGAIVLAVLLLAAAGATYARYESFDACVWLEHDLAEETGLPRVIAEAQIRAEFLVRGIDAPDPGDCLLAWWEFRADGASQAPK